MTNPADCLVVCAHELGHAIVGRALGSRIRLVVTAPGSTTRGWTEHYPRTDLSPLEFALCEATILLAGEAAGQLIPHSGYVADIDGCAERATRVGPAALDRLPPDEAGFVAYIQSDMRPGGKTDQEKVALLTESAAREERNYFLGFAAARAQRLVAANVQLIGALLPVALANPFLSGEDVEKAIAGHLARQ